MKLNSLNNYLQKIYNILSVLSVFTFFETLLFKGFLFNESPELKTFSLIVNSVCIILYLLWFSLKILRYGWNPAQLLPEIITSLLILGTVFSVRFGGIIVSLRIFSIIFANIFKKSGVSHIFSQIRPNPARIMLLTFLGLIIFGTILLMLPAATTDHKGAGFIDAIFTSTSAACVTGLIVKDTATYFTIFGQLIILGLIQVGGLGIMTFSSVFAIFLGRRMGIRHEEQIREMLDQDKSVNVSMVVKQILAITIIFELVGTLLLSIRFIPEFGFRAGVYHAFYHSIAAFCNAGFSTFTLNLVDYSGDFIINMTIIFLIIFGGIGFMVINDLIINMKNLNPMTLKWSRLEVHTKLVLMTTVSLIIAGTLAVFFFEFDNALINLPVPQKLMAALFQSVSFRTAGFNTIDFSSLNSVTLFIGVLLMFIGASPSSTGGGIKTTTFAVLLLSVRSLLMSGDKVEFFHRNIMPQTVYKAVAILLFSSTFIIAFTILLLVTQPFGFLNILFEAVSAIGTVGLSTGITPALDYTGKILITCLMYVGRVGPLTVALALGEVRKSKLEYPTTRISVG